ncbi:MAG: PEP-CTERM sorting domain-containing protein [Verrucomicrobia bacterium]|nr:PEP-CTERM sorting domain-containing protein [Verrucomicrobiota bacterium]
MRTRPIQHATLLALAGLYGALFLQTSSGALTVLPGWDLFTTDSRTTFNGVHWTGVPLSTYNFGGLIGTQYVGTTDTIMQRMGTSGNGEQITLRLDVLQFVSTDPIFGPGLYGYITLQTGQASGGTVTINNDFTYSAQFNVYYDLHVGSLNGDVYASGEIANMTGSGNWQHDPTADALTIPGVNYHLNGTPPTYSDGNTANDFWPIGVGGDVPGSLITESASAFDETHVFFTTIIPEPSSLALLCLGVFSLAIKRRRTYNPGHLRPNHQIGTQ